MKDIKFLTLLSGILLPKILGKLTDLYLAACQKVIIILLSSTSGLFRDDYGTLLTLYLGNTNYTLSNLAVIKATVSSQLSNSLLPQLKTLILDISFSLSHDNNLAIDIILTNGKTYSGTIK